MKKAESVLDTLREMRIVDCERNRWYSALVDDRTTGSLRGFDLEKLPYGEPDDATDPRDATNRTGLMAFCWANPWSRYYRDERFLTHIKARLAEFARTQVDGCPVFRKKRKPKVNPQFSEGRQNLNLAISWYVEPLVLAANWIADELSDEETEQVTTLARWAADMLCALPCNEMHNRATVRCAVLCLLGRFLGDDTYIEIAMHDFHREPVRVFNKLDGQINEGSGPDANYSGTSYVYCYTYRVLSGDLAIDPAMVDALRWYAFAADNHGCPSWMGASTRVAISEPSKVVDFVPAFERYADVEPDFNWLIENHYRKAIAAGGPGHICSPLIWAMFEHDGTPPEAKTLEQIRVLQPGPRSDAAGRRNPSGAAPAGRVYKTVNEGCDALYYVFRQDYHATTTLHGRAPYKGLQNWGYKQEPPVIWPTLTHASKTRCWGMDTARQRTSGTKFHDYHWIRTDPNVFVDRFDEVWHHYVFTRTTMLYLVSTDRRPREDIFVICKKRCGVPRLGETALTYAERQGRLHFAQKPRALKELENGWQLFFNDDARTHLYAFSNESFELLEFHPEGDVVRFADDTGTYELTYELRFYADDDLVPIGTKGFGQNDITRYVKTEARRLG